MVLADFGFLETKYALNRDGKFWYVGVIDAPPPWKRGQMPSKVVETSRQPSLEMQNSQIKHI